ncbi:MAG TPA: TIGR00303 family protein [Candidatus Nitrosotenuis sp.]|nr:TIGR00303 family protein [Candidatus Nitrosotenuis sp.]
MNQDIDVLVDQQKGREFLESVEKKHFLFSLVISYTDTCTIPGITVAGKNPALLQYTPPADAEFLNFGYCKCINVIPMTPDGKPTPALLTKTALEAASISNIVINAGSKILPKMPYFETGLPFGKNIAAGPAMSLDAVTHAVEYGRMIGRSLGSITDCLVLGESIPGGTTTAQAVLASLGVDAKVSSSMQDNPLALKYEIANAASKRIDSKNPFDVVANAGDPMIPTIAGILSTASSSTKVILAGGTQMAAVLAFSKITGYDKNNTAIATTSYVTEDKTANLVDTIKQIDQIPVFSVRLALKDSKISGLRSFADGFVKEGVGAGGASLAAMLKVGIDSNHLLQLTEKQYENTILL